MSNFLGIALSCFLLIFPLQLFGKDVHVVGYVHSHFSGGFELNGTRVECSSKTLLEPSSLDVSGQIPANCDGVRVGDHVSVTGAQDPAAKVLFAKRILIDPIKVEPKLRGYALLDRDPELVKQANGWSGLLYADGRVIQVTPSTKISFSPNTVLQTVEQVHANVYIGYEAASNYEGELKAADLVFLPNDTSAEEQQFRDREKPAIKEPDYSSKTPGEFTCGPKCKFELLPDKDMQSRVQKIGSALIPQFLREMPGTDPNRIEFRFYVVSSKKTITFASSNGWVLLSSDIVTRLDNDARLAAILSYGVATIVQEQEFRQQDRKHLQRDLGWTLTAGSIISPAATVAGFINDAAWRKYQRAQNEQAVRVGMDYMQRAGFDIREVGPAWAAMRQKSIDADDAQVALGRYAFDEIRRYHSHDDFDALTTKTKPTRPTNSEN